MIMIMHLFIDTVGMNENYLTYWLKIYASYKALFLSLFFAMKYTFNKIRC